MVTLFTVAKQLSQPVILPSGAYSMVLRQEDYPPGVSQLVDGGDLRMGSVAPHRNHQV